MSGISRAQSLMHGSGPGGPVLTFSTDAAILEAGDPRTDLPCTVTPVKPALGFDLRFHAGYEVAVPLKDLAGEDNLLTMIFRVTPETQKDQPIYFSQHVSVPKIDENSSGQALLQGTFDLGEGNYHIDWLMRDRSERVCSSYWDAAAELTAKDRTVRLAILPSAVQAADAEPFRQEPPVQRDASSDPLNVKIMVNFAPQESSAATLQPLDTSALISILRNISREPRICKFSVVAFNMQEQRVVYRQEQAEQIDFPALGEADKSLNLGTINLKKLEQKHADSDFLTDLISHEVSAGKPDAVIFAGPKAMVDKSVPVEVGDLAYPVFYMNYNLNPVANPWRDAIGNAVRKMKGYEYTISRPRDLWVAWSDIITRIVRLKVGRQALTHTGSQ